MMKSLRSAIRLAATRWLPGALLALPLLLAANAHASLFEGEMLDKVADVLSWVVLIVAPLVGIAVFLLVHILPEQIAERKQHPQAKAIQTLCLLSLVFGGLLWPLAWLWAYSKPVLYKMAYGTDKAAHGQQDDAQASSHADEAPELERLRKRIAELETKQAGKSAAEGATA
jgi:CBS domain containing-hemolysin-like protein